MLAEGRGVGAAEGLAPDDLVLNGLPGHHGFGFMSVHFEAALAGASTLFWSDPRPMLIARDAMAGAIAATRVTVLPGVPLIFDALSAAGAADLSSLRLAFTGGVGLKRPVYDRFRARYGIALGQAYGCTEAGQVAFHPGGGEEAWASVGTPQANATIAVVPSPDAPEGSGEVVIGGASDSAGYLEADAASRASFHAGAFHTGDLGRLDADGRLYVTGRSRLIIEVGGHKIDPVEVEDVFAEHPAVAEAVVVGIPDGRTGEQRLKLFAVLRGEAGSEDLIAFARGRLAAQKVPAAVEFLDAIPRSASGKVLRGMLIEGS
jgi:long-chain acyl-CoA synthetase